MDGKEITASKTFTADKRIRRSHHEVHIRCICAFQHGDRRIRHNLYKDSTQIAVHADINDEGQTVSLESDKPPASPKTGDDMKLFILFALMIAAGASATAVRAISRKKRIKEEKTEE